jgi:hypothetical protein
VTKKKFVDFGRASRVWQQKNKANQALSANSRSGANREFLIGATLGVLTALVIADLTKGTGRFNLAQGLVGTVSGVGASLSTSISGLFVERFGQTASFVSVMTVARFHRDPAPVDPDSSDAGWKPRRYLTLRTQPAEESDMVRCYRSSRAA